MVYDWTLQYQFVAFIDVLGQTRRLLRLRKLPATEDEKKETAVVLDETAGYIMGLRKGFMEYFQAGNSSTGRLDCLPADKQAMAEKLRRSEVFITSISDSIIMAVPLSNEDDHCMSINSIYSALYGICGIFLLSLAERKPFRCGVDVGLGVRLTEHEFYGSGGVKAYYLQDKVAQYPRIVVGDSLFNYLSSVQGLVSDTLLATFAKKKAGDCKSLVTHDHDGLRILDVIGEGVKSVGGIDEQLVQKAYTFIVQCHDSLSKSGDYKLRARYGLLRKYFESRIQLWNVQAIRA